MRENRKSKGKRPMKNTSRQGNISPCRGESAGFFLISSPQANCQLDKRLAVDKIHGSLTSVDVSVPLPRVLRRGDLGEWDKFHSPQEQTLLCNLPCIRYPAGAAPCFQRISPGSRFFPSKRKPGFVESRRRSNAQAFAGTKLATRRGPVAMQQVVVAWQFAGWSVGASRPLGLLSAPVFSTSAMIPLWQ